MEEHKVMAERVGERTYSKISDSQIDKVFCPWLSALVHDGFNKTS